MLTNAIWANLFHVEHLRWNRQITSMVLIVFIKSVVCAWFCVWYVAISIITHGSLFNQLSANRLCTLWPRTSQNRWSHRYIKPMYGSCRKYPIKRDCNPVHSEIKYHAFFESQTNPVWSKIDLADACVFSNRKVLKITWSLLVLLFLCWFM